MHFAIIILIWFWFWFEVYPEEITKLKINDVVYREYQRIYKIENKYLNLKFYLNYNIKILYKLK